MLEHGGNLHEAIVRYGRAREDWIDLSTGINPHYYPITPLASDAWHRLPEASNELTNAAQQYYRAPLILPVAGTQTAIQALPRLRLPSRVVVAAPSYAEHAHHWTEHGHQMWQVPYDELDAAVEDCDVMVVCNPNNPTGAIVAPERLLAWSQRLTLRGGWLVVDEAFGDTVPDRSVAPWSGQAGLIVLRSVGKFFGLAGMRLGFVAACPDLLNALHTMLGPWTVSGPAQQIGCAALNDRAWQSAMRAQLITSGQRLHHLLREYGMEATGTALFQWWPEKQAEAFKEHMAERGIWVRLFQHAARGIRVGLPADEIGWQRLMHALEQWKKGIRT